ncbi:MAG: hypothetical protein KBB94_01925 [Legionellaceae bacterium]|nr:hypothetical protein [Legionellaceae bacterium]MBP9774849.1 hypothetical protein [Legionellaceae bacterium]
MSNNKMSINIEEQVQGAPTAVQAHYQAYITAMQQTHEYREKLAHYEDNAHLVQNIKEDDELLEAVGSIINMASSTFSSLTNFLSYGETVTTTSVTPAPEAQAVVIPVVLQDIPTKEELSRLCRARDAAFFKYMRSLELEIPTETQVFEQDNRQLVAADVLTKPYLKDSVYLRRELVRVAEEIETTLKIQRTWMDFIIESVFPAFLLKLMDYMTFQDMNNEKAAELRKGHAAIRQLHSKLDVAFEQQWFENYATKPPQDLRAANSNLLAKYVHEINIDSLVAAYTQYNKTKTVSNLIDLYRLAFQLQHQSGQSDEMWMKTQSLGGIMLQLEKLHPDMGERLENEKSTSEREMQLLDTYRAVHTPQDNADKKATFLRSLADKYRTFLKTRNFDNFDDLYQYIHAHPQFRRENLVKKTRALLKEQYSEAYQVVREHYIPHINEQACEEFLNKYEKCNYEHPIYTQIIGFMREPTLSALVTLEQLMFNFHDANYDQDQGFAHLVSDFMQICSTISVTSAADMRSEQYSVSSFDDTESTGSLSPSGSTTARAVRSNSLDVTAPKLSEQALQRHNAEGVRYDPRIFRQSERIEHRTFERNDDSLANSAIVA